MDQKLFRLFWIWILVGLAFAAQSFACTLPEVEQSQVEVVPGATPQPLAKKTVQSEVLLGFIQRFNPRLDESTAREIAREVMTQSQARGVDPFLVAALFARESSFNPFAVSKTNAKGLGQLKDFHYEKYQVSDPFNIVQNVRASIALLADLKNSWRGELSWENSFSKDELMLSSYFIGLGATKRSNGELPEKAQKYIKEILDYRNQAAAFNS